MQCVLITFIYQAVLCCAEQVKKDFQEAVLSYRQDEFFRKNMYANFGDIGSAVKELVDEFQKQTSNTKRINTIEDMQVGSSLPPACRPAKICCSFMEPFFLTSHVLQKKQWQNMHWHIFLVVHTAIRVHCARASKKYPETKLYMSPAIHHAHETFVRYLNAAELCGEFQ